MNRTKLLREIGRMRFVGAYAGWRSRRLTQGEAARLLGVCDRTFRVAWMDTGKRGGLVDKRLGQVVARRAPVGRMARAEALRPASTAIVPRAP